jgi:ATP-binding cassette subfamily B protein IrtB
MRRIWHLMMVAAGPYRADYIASVRNSLIGSIAQAGAYACLIPILIALSQPIPDPSAAWTWFAVFVGFYAFETCFHVLELNFQYEHWADVLADLRLRIGDRLRTMRARELEERAAGDLATLVGGAVANATVGISTAGLLFLQFLVVPTVLFIVICILDWRLGAVLLLAVPFALIFVRRLQRLSGGGMRRIDEADAQAASRIVEYVQGLPVLKAAGQAGAASTRLSRALHTQGETMSATHKTLTWPGLLASSAVQIGIVAMVALGAGLLLFDNSLPAVLLAAIVAAAVRFAEPLSVAAQMTVVFEVTDAALERVGEVLDAEPLPVRSPAMHPEGSQLVFHDVTFGYGDEPVVKDVTFTANEHSLTALVGTSGSGKTTITRLITRYDDPRSGTISIGGADLRHIDPIELNRNVAVVFQDVYLFDDTIRANIAMAHHDASDDDVRRAAEAAHIDEFIDRLPDGYDTRVGEIGGSLSSGERQRISIARAILKNAPIVILDEPTAALDTESEVAVQHAIDALVADKTVIVIAHRLSTVVNADRIIILDDGKIIEQGQHANLIAAGGRYARLWAAQTAERYWTAASR